MRNHALGLSRELSRHCEVTVFTRTEPTPEGDGLELRPILDNDIHEDVKKLRTHEADAWLVLTAGYADFARHTDLPTFVYCHGNDFLNPWVLQDTAADRLARIWARTPLVWRAEKLRHALLRPTRRAAIGRGLRHAAHVFTNSDYTRRILVDLWPGLDGKLTVSYPGVDEMFFAPPAASAAGRAARDTLRMISIARLSRVQSAIKNIDSSLEALARTPGGNSISGFRLSGTATIAHAWKSCAAGSVSTTGSTSSAAWTTETCQRAWTRPTCCSFPPAKASGSCTRKQPRAAFRRS